MKPKSLAVSNLYKRSLLGRLAAGPRSGHDFEEEEILGCCTLVQQGRGATLQSAAHSVSHRRCCQRRAAARRWVTDAAAPLAGKHLKRC